MSPIPPPEAHETAVPPYGIRALRPNAPAYKMPQAFQRIGEDVSAALAEFGLPPVVSAATVVAATQAARDAHWGVPANAAAQLALQARGATTIRTDRGWEERYLAAYHATTNPGGATPAGWYPVGGRMPFADAPVPVATGLAANAWIALVMSAPAMSGVTWASGQPSRLVATIGGRYRCITSATVQSTSDARLRLAVNGATMYGEMGGAVAGGVGRPATSVELTLAAGDYVEAQMLTNQAAAQLFGGRLSLAYSSPAL